MSTKTPILLVIDLQQLIVDGPKTWGPRSTPDLTTTVPKILSAFRANNFPIVHVLHQSSDPSSPVHATQTANVAPHPCAAPLEGEPVVVKLTGSPFVNTSLVEVLENLGGKEKNKLVVIGVDGAECVNSTVRSAADLGWEVQVVPEACASYAVGNRRGEEGEIIEADVVHKVAMAILVAYAKLVGVEELLGELGGKAEKL
ncbi:isochorismatase hydrolase protein [Rutstroemia sp. NJR-2017a BVV2]|nr:isochorismatase hydrolase protein [Rutstroemia sp. NJR-2017a BVV2]